MLYNIHSLSLTVCFSSKFHHNLSNATTQWIEWWISGAVNENSSNTGYTFEITTRWAPFLMMSAPFTSHTQKNRFLLHSGNSVPKTLFIATLAQYRTKKKTQQIVVSFMNPSFNRGDCMCGFYFASSFDAAFAIWLQFLNKKSINPNKMHSVGSVAGFDLAP